MSSDRRHLSNAELHPQLPRAPHRRRGTCWQGGFTGILLAALGGCTAAPSGVDAVRGPLLIHRPGAALEARIIRNWPVREDDARPGAGVLASFLFGSRRPPRLSLRTPQGLTVSGRDVLVCDQGRLAVMGVSIDEAGVRVHAGDAGFRAPVDIAIGPGDRVFVVDAECGALFELDAQGSRVGRRSPAREGEARDFTPVSAAVLGDQLAVGCLRPGRVERFDPERNEWAMPLTSGYAGVSIGAPTGMCSDAEEILYVADAIAGCVHRFLPSGEAMPPVGRRGRGEGELIRPKDVCVTPSGLIAVTDAARQSVMVFDREGVMLLEIGRSEAGWAGFSLPCGIVSLGGTDGEAATPGGAPERLLVSDSLGAAPLTLIELQRVDRAKEGP